MEYARQIAGAFPTSTAQADEHHPRHLRHLQEPALVALTQLWRLVAAFGNFPKSQRSVATRLRPQKNRDRAATRSPIPDAAQGMGEG